MKPTFWNGPDRAEKEKWLLDLVAADIPFAKIAKIMGAKSRNIILGKYSRLRKKNADLKAPPGPAQLRELKPAKQKSTKPSLPEESKVEPLTFAGNPIDLETLGKHMCTYPYGVPGEKDFHYCGHPQRPRSPYCEVHHAACHDKNGSKRISHHAGHRS